MNYNQSTSNDLLFRSFSISLCRSLDSTAKFETDAWIERIVLLGYSKNPSRVTIHSGDKQANPIHSYDQTSQVLVIRRPGPSVNTDWTLTLS